MFSAPTIINGYTDRKKNSSSSSTNAIPRARGNSSSEWKVRKLAHHQGDSLPSRLQAIRNDPMWQNVVPINFCSLQEFDEYDEVKQNALLCPVCRKRLSHLDQVSPLDNFSEIQQAMAAAGDKSSESNLPSSIINSPLSPGCPMEDDPGGGGQTPSSDYSSPPENGFISSGSDQILSSPNNSTATIPSAKKKSSSIWSSFRKYVSSVKNVASIATTRRIRCAACGDSFQPTSASTSNLFSSRSQRALKLLCDPPDPSLHSILVNGNSPTATGTVTSVGETTGAGSSFGSSETNSTSATARKRVSFCQDVTCATLIRNEPPSMLLRPTGGMIYCPSFGLPSSSNATTPPASTVGGVTMSDELIASKSATDTSRLTSSSEPSLRGLDCPVQSYEGDDEIDEAPGDLLTAPSLSNSSSSDTLATQSAVLNGSVTSGVSASKTPISPLATKSSSPLGTLSGMLAATVRQRRVSGERNRPEIRGSVLPLASAPRPKFFRSPVSDCTQPGFLAANGAMFERGGDDAPVTHRPRSPPPCNTKALEHTDDPLIAAIARRSGIHSSPPRSPPPSSSRFGGSVTPQKRHVGTSGHHSSHTTSKAVVAKRTCGGNHATSTTSYSSSS